MGDNVSVPYSPEHIVSLYDDLRQRGWIQTAKCRNIPILDTMRKFSVQQQTKKGESYFVDVCLDDRISDMDQSVRNDNILVHYLDVFPSNSISYIVFGDKNTTGEEKIWDCSKENWKTTNHFIKSNKGHFHNSFVVITRSLINGKTSAIICRCQANDTVFFLWAVKIEEMMILIIL